VLRDPLSPSAESGSAEGASLARRLHWLIAVRLAAVTSFAIAAFLLELARPAESPDADFLYALVGLIYFATLAYLALLRFLPNRPRLQAVLQIGGDLLFTTGLVYYFGGVSSPSSVLYFLVIILAASILGTPGGFLAATAAWALYALTVWGITAGWLVPPGELGALLIPRWRLLYNVVAHAAGFYAVAYLTARLAGSATTTARELEVERADLAHLRVVHQDVVESIPSGLITCDLAGLVTSVNPAAREILALGARHAVGEHVTATGLISSAEWADIVRNPGRASHLRTEAEVPIGDAVKTIGFSVSRLTSAEGVPAGFIVIFQDLSDWRRLQDEVRMKDRMAAVGEMAAGIAHEIGNPLAALSGSVQLLSGSLADDGRHRPLLDIIFKESQRLDRTIKGFLRFARPRERTSSRFDIAALLRENVEHLRNSPEVSPRHELGLELEPPAAELLADPDQVAQIFWNLARNALRAMPDGGALRVRGTLADASYRIEFADTGRGMTEEQRIKLFHPFQSFFDAGTGIGMAIVYRIVQEHGGQLAVESAPGSGTRITVTLPVPPPAAPAHG
jgi:two-component system sensor histidine kinase PilS (NtrC family)